MSVKYFFAISAILFWIMFNGSMINTADENIIGAPKMWNDFWLKCKYLTYLNLLSIKLSLFQLITKAKEKDVAPNLSDLIKLVEWFMASFLYCSQNSYRSSNYRGSNSCIAVAIVVAFSFLKTIAKSKEKLIDNYRESNSCRFFNFLRR